ncbi:hypothetical protein ACXWTF_11965 [Thiomicrolovo sp. ZZH C-3]
MKMVYMVVSLIAAGMVAAATVGHSRILLSSQGAKTLFVRAEAKTFDPAEQAASEHARQATDKAPHAGEVFYKRGVREAAFRHVTTGRIVVRFVPGVDPEAFAVENGLELRRSFGIGGRSAVFINQSDSDDITKSNALLQQQSVESAEPDWVLPVTVY